MVRQRGSQSLLLDIAKQFSCLETPWTPWQARAEVESLRLLRQKALESAAAQRLEQTLEVRATVDVSRESLRNPPFLWEKSPELWESLGIQWNLFVMGITGK